jgi:hypothetical protein
MSKKNRNKRKSRPYKLDAVERTMLRIGGTVLVLEHDESKDEFTIYKARLEKEK